MDEAENTMKFEDLVNVDDFKIQTMLKAMDMETLAIALKTASPAVSDKITKNMSERACAELENKIQKMVRVKQDDEEECRTVILSYIK